MSLKKNAPKYSLLHGRYSCGDIFMVLDSGVGTYDPMMVVCLVKTSSQPGHGKYWNDIEPGSVVERTFAWDFSHRASSCRG